MPPTIALSTGSLHTYGTARGLDMAAAAGFDAVAEHLRRAVQFCREPLAS